MIADTEKLADELAREMYVEVRNDKLFHMTWERLDADLRQMWLTAARHLVEKGWAKVDFWTERLTDEQASGLLQSLPQQQRLRLAADVLDGLDSTLCWTPRMLRHAADDTDDRDAKEREKAELQSLIETAYQGDFSRSRTVADRAKILAGAIVAAGWRKKADDA